MEQIRDYSLQEFEDLILKHFNKIYDLELLILKGHILTEFTINCYLETLSKNDEPNFFKENFTYEAKTKLLSHFADKEDNNSDLFRALKMLNNIRNGIAHSLIINDQILIEYLTLVNKLTGYDKSFKNEHYDIRLRFSMATGYLCGTIFKRYFDKRNKKK